MIDMFQIKYKPGDQVEIIDSGVKARVNEVKIGFDYISYNLRWWNDRVMNNCDFGENEIKEWKNRNNKAGII